MAFAGSLHDIPLSDILQLLASQGKSGTLTLSHGRQEIRIGIADGKAVDADCSLKPLALRLGTKLVSAGKLAAADLEKALSLQRTTGRKLGQILVAEGMVAGDDVRRVLRLQFQQILYDAMRWPDGTYAFERGDVDYDRDYLEPLGFQGILLDCMRMIDEWPMLEKRLARRDLVLHRVTGDAAAGGDGGAAAPADADGEESSEVEAEVYRRVDGRSTIQQIIDRTLHIEFDVCRAVANLWERGLVWPAYEGELGEIAFPELVLAIRQARGTGRLELTRAGTTRTVLFRDGAFDGARSSDPDDAIGPYLLRSGRIGRRDLDLAAGSRVRSEAVGEHLARLGALEPAQLERSRVEQAAAVIHSLFAWSEGTYRYHPEATVDPGPSLLAGETPALVLGGIRSIDRWSRLERAVGPPGTMYHRNEDADPEVWAMLDAADRRQLELFAEGCSVDEACDRAETSAFQLHQTIWAGRMLGLLAGGVVSATLTGLVDALSDAAPEEAPAGDAAAAAPGSAEAMGGELVALPDLDPGELLPEPEVSADSSLLLPVPERVPSPYPPVGPCPPTHAPPPRTGRISGATLADLLRGLYLARSAGVLSLSHRGERVALLLQRGTVVAASSADEKLRFGLIAVRLGMVTERALQAVVLEERSGPLGSALVARGLLTPEQLSTVVETQIRDIVLPVFNWGETQYEVRDRPPGTAELPGCNLTSAELILAGAREVTATSQLADALAERGTLAPSTDPLRRFQRLRLAPEEASLLSLVDGRRSLAELVAATPLDEREAIRIVFGLHAAGILAPARDADPPGPATDLRVPAEAPALDHLPALAERIGQLDPGAILGIDASASPEAVRAAAARLARKYHPDHGRTPAEKLHLERILDGVIAARDAILAPALAAVGA